MKLCNNCCITLRHEFLKHEIITVLAAQDTINHGRRKSTHITETITNCRDSIISGIKIPEDYLRHLVSMTCPFPLNILKIRVYLINRVDSMANTPSPPRTVRRLRNTIKRYASIKFHVGEDVDSGRHVFDFYVLLQSGVQKHIKYRLYIGIHTPVRLNATVELIDNINSLKSYQLRMSGESNEVICEWTMCLICNISAHRNCSFHRGAAHRARYINNRDAILLSAIVEVLEIIPILLKHKTSRIFKASIVTHCKSSVSNVMRIQCVCIYRGILVLGKSFILLSKNVTPCKSIAINESCLRRDLIKLDFIPAVCAHQTLKNVDALTQSRKSLTILAAGHSQKVCQDMSKFLSICIRCILRRHPFCKQGWSLALNIKSKLMLDDIKCGGLHLSAFSNVNQVIPTTILANVLKICLSNLRIFVAKPTKSGSEEASFSLHL